MISKRIQTRVRARYPLLVPLCGLIAGQLVGSLPNHIPEISLLASAFLCVWRKYRNVFFAPLFIGLLSVLIVSTAHHPLFEIPNKQPSSWIVKLDQIRHPKSAELAAFGVIIGCTHGFGSVYGNCPLQGRMQLRGPELPWKVWGGVQKGDTVLVQGKFNPFEVTWNPFSYTAAMVRRGYVGTLRVQFARILASDSPQGSAIGRAIRKVSLFVEKYPSGSLFLSMAFGTRDCLSDIEETRFRNLGLSHLLVFSGYQVALLFWSVRILLLWMLRFLRGRYWWYAERFISVVVFGALCLIITELNREISTMRALIALGVVQGASLLERPLRFGQLLIASMWIISIVWPGSLLEPGAELTFAALCGIGLTQHYRGIRGALLGMCGIGVCTSLVSLLWFGNASLIGFVLNPILVPIISLLTCNVGYVASFLFCMNYDSQGFALRICVQILDWIVQVLEKIDPRSAPETGSLYLLAGAFLLVLVFFMRRGFWRWRVLEGV